MSYNLIPLNLDKNTGKIVAHGVPVVPPTFDPAYGFIHLQAVASDTWTIIHDGGSDNIITQIFATSGEQIFPDEVVPLDVNTLQVSFGAPQDGKALLMLFI